MNRYLQLFFVSVASFMLTFSATAQEFDLLLAEEFEATTIPAGWIEATQDPALYPTSGPIPSGGWEYGVTSYLTGLWDVPTSIDASGFAYSNDDQDPAPSGTDRSDDFLGVGFFDMTNYDSLTVLFDRFQNGQWGSVSFFYIANSTEAVIFPIPDNAAWFEDGLTIVNGQVLVTNPFVFDDQVVIGFIHNDNPDDLADGNWGAGLAVDNVILAGWLPPCETTGLIQVPASSVSAVGGQTTTISTMQNTGGEYSVVTNVQGSTEYDIAHTGGAYVTVRTGSATGDVLSAGFTPLTITTLSTDDLYLIWSDDQFCSSGAGTGTNTSSITGGAEVCAADAGALFAASGANACIGDELVAGEAIAPSTPTGYDVLYVVTDGAGNVVAGPFTTPTYTPVAEGTFVIHTLVLDPADQATILAQVPNGALAVANLFEENGGTLCGSLDLVGAAFTVVDCPDNNDCEDATPIACGDAIAGTNVNASVDVNGIDAGGVWYVFQGNGQSVTFSTCDNADYDTRIDVFRGTGCADLEYYGGNDDGTGCTGYTSEYEMYAHPDSAYYVYVSGYDAFSAGSFTLSVTCLCPTIDAGTLTADASPVCMSGGSATISATEGTAPIVPTGYVAAYVLTTGVGLDVVDANVAPTFTVAAAGDYTIHTLVLNPADQATLLGQTTGGDVAALLSGNGGTPLCGALDVTGAPITVNPEPTATLSGDVTVCDGNAEQIQIDLTGVGPWDVTLVTPTQNVDLTGIATSPMMVNVTVAGAYSLSSVNDANCPGTVSGTADVVEESTAESSWSFVQVPNTLDVDFTDASMNGPTSWLWDFGDGNTSTMQNPTHTYAADGNYTVCLTVTNDCGSDSACAAVQVAPAGPANDLCVNATPIACDDVVTGSTEFATDTDASDCDADGFGVWYSIVGDGSFITLDLSGSDYDTYLGVTESCGGVCLASDDDGGDGTTSMLTFASVNGQTYYIQVSGFGANTGNYSLAVTCTPPAANEEPCGATALAAGANGPYAHTTYGASGWETTFVAPEVGCTEQGGWCIDLDIENSAWYSFEVPPSGNVTISTDGSSFDTQLAIIEALTCQDVEAGTGTIVGANDDDPNASGSGGSTLTSIVHLCGLPPGETYWALVDGWNGATGDLVVNVTETTVAADFTSTSSGLTADFTDASTASGTIVSWAWDFGDGNTSTDQNPSHTYGAADTYTVCLTVTDDAGCTSEFCTTVIVDITISIAEAVENGMAVYPNPSNGDFVVEIRGVEADIQLNVLDLAGRVVYTEGAVLNGDFRKDLSLDVATGSYLLQIATEEGLVTRKIQIH